MSGRSPTLPRASIRGTPASRPVVSNRSSTDSRVTGTRRKANVYLPPGYQRQQVPGAVPAARHRGRRDGMDPLRDAGRPLRQPDRRQSGGADDRTYAPSRTEDTSVKSQCMVERWQRGHGTAAGCSTRRRTSASWLSTGASATACRSPLSPVSGQTHGSPTSVSLPASMLRTTAGLRR